MEIRVPIGEWDVEEREAVLGKVVYFYKIHSAYRACSSDGRAIALHAIGNGIDARILQIGKLFFPVSLY